MKRRLFIEGIIIIFIIIIFFMVNNYIDNSKKDRIYGNYKYNIDSINYNPEDGVLSIQGWIIEVGKACDTNMARKDFELVLSDVNEKNRIIETETTVCSRADVSKYYENDGVDYTYCGFLSKVKVEKENDYRILFKFKQEEKYLYSFYYIEKLNLVSKYSEYDNVD